MHASRCIHRARMNQIQLRIHGPSLIFSSNRHPVLMLDHLSQQLTQAILRYIKSDYIICRLPKPWVNFNKIRQSRKENTRSKIAYAVFR